MALRAAAGARLAALGVFAVAAVGLWQASSLERWSFEGPGPGLFPLLAGGVCALLALVVTVWPGRAAAGDSGDSGDSGDGLPPDASQRRAGDRRFACYVAALAFLAVAPGLLGITISAIAIAVLLIRVAEGRSWRAAVSYGVCAAVIALVGFGWLLRVDLPSGPIEQAFFALVR
jgi:hypothetical protein